MSLDTEKTIALLRVIHSYLPKLSRAKQIVLKEHLKHIKNFIDAKYLLDYLKAPDIWRYPKVSVDTFLDDPFFLGSEAGTSKGTKVYPKVRQICKSVIEGKYKEWVEVAWIWSGKSFSAEILACYSAHHLLCLRNPHNYYHLTQDKAIAIINMWINATQANVVVFEWIKSFIEGSPWFMGQTPKILAGTVEFEKHKLLMVSGNSKSTMPLGYNVFAAILDEAAFYLDNENKSIAAEIYEWLQRRIVSRFGHEWLLMMISSPRYIDDFIMKKLAESRERTLEWELVAPHVYSIQLPTWKVKAIDNADMEGKFYFNCRQNTVIEWPELEHELTIRKVNYVSDSNFDDTYDIREIPGEYKASFRQNPDKAKRDYGATPSLTLTGYFPSPEIISSIRDRSRTNPVTRPWQYEFPERPLRVNYYIHVDIWLNRDGEGDHTGFAMWHFNGWYNDPDTWESLMQFTIDLTERIGTIDAKGEVDLAGIRQRIYDLKAMGYNISLVTFDWYQSKDTMQILKKKGFTCEYVSVDRTIDPYNLLKEAVYDKRISIPYYEPLDSELSRLELIRWVKVDHPKGGSKDCSDAVAWVVFNIHTHTPQGTLGMKMHQTQNEPESIRYHREQKEKEQQYDRQQRILNRQNEMMNKMWL